MDNNSFKQVKDETKSYSIPKAKVGFFRGFFVPFLAGALGSVLLIGAAFSIPPVKEFVLDKLAIETKQEDTNIQNTEKPSIAPSSDTQISLKVLRN